MRRRESKGIETEKMRGGRTVGRRNKGKDREDRKEKKIREKEKKEGNRKRWKIEKDGKGEKEKGKKNGMEIDFFPQKGIHF